MTAFLQWWANHWPLVPVLLLLGTRVSYSKMADYIWITVRVLIFEFEYERRREP